MWNTNIDSFFALSNFGGFKKFVVWIKICFVEKCSIQKHMFSIPNESDKK